jgi:hypothetical protein
MYIYNIIFFISVFCGQPEARNSQEPVLLTYLYLMSVLEYIHFYLLF